MAEAMVSFLINKLGDFAFNKLGDIAIGEAQCLKRIGYDISCIKDDLSLMQAFLKDADKISAASETVKELVKQVKDLAFQIEDFLDLYMYQENALLDGDSTSSITSVSSKSSFYLRMSSHIERMKENVRNVCGRVATFGFHHTLEEGERTTVTRESLGNSLNLFEEPEMVGFEDDLKKLVDWLLSEEEYSLMSLVGIGGSGKTTLARKAYKLVENHFDFHYWIDASRDSSAKNVMEDIKHDSIKGSESKVEVNPQLQSTTTSETTMCEEINNFLQKKRSLIIFDDIYDKKLLPTVKAWLPHNGKCRILFTHRETIKASSLFENFHVHNMNPLPHELSWQLFCKKAFQHTNPPGTCPDYLSDLGAEIVRKCCGLPLAIVLMGGLMSTKDDNQRKWKDVLNHFDKELHYNPCLESLNQILQASYDHLPSQLKYCFLSCCLFPKSSEIKRKKIIRLWVAQGFVQRQQWKTLEEVADDYFDQLIGRNMLQPVISNFTGELISFKVHDMVRSFAVNKNEEFGHFLFDFDSCDPYEVRMNRHRYVGTYDGYFLLCLKNNQLEIKVRSVLVFDPIPSNSAKYLVGKVFKSIKLVRVLHLDGIPIENLPDEVGDLFHLTYLGLRGTLLQYLPNSLGKLHNLETLDVRDTRIEKVPVEMQNLKKLRHLLLRSMKIYSHYELVEMLIHIYNFSLLLTLSGVTVDMFLARELGSLTQLKKLYIRMVNQTQRQEVFTCIGQIENLSSLKIECRDSMGKFTELKLEMSLPLPAYLEKLALGGIIHELPQWFDDFKSLRVLNLVNSMLVADPLSNLANLPNLVSLSLYHAYTGEKMGCGPGGFPKLRHLHLASLIEFSEWTRIEEGTMACIQILSIVDCDKLGTLPEGLEQLQTLQSLEVLEMPEKFIERLVTDGFSKIQHIPKLTLLPSTEACSTSTSVGDGTGTMNIDTKHRRGEPSSSSSSHPIESSRKRKLRSNFG